MSNQGHSFSVSSLGDTVTTYFDGEVARRYVRIAPTPSNDWLGRPLNAELLRGPKMKLLRGLEHVRALEEHIQQWGNREPFQSDISIDPSTGDKVYTLILREPVPVFLSAIIGDAAHNLRSALDHLVCEMARQNGSAPHQNGGLQIKARAQHRPPGSQPKLQGISARTERVFRWIQGSDKLNEVLFILNMLDVIDKHNVVLTAAAATVEVKLRVGIPGLFVGQNGELNLLGGGSPYMFDNLQPVGFEPIWPIDGPTEYYRTHPDFPENVSGTIDVVFGPGMPAAGECVVDQLYHAAALVERVIGAIERHCL